MEVATTYSVLLSRVEPVTIVSESANQFKNIVFSFFQPIHYVRIKAKEVPNQIRPRRYVSSVTSTHSDFLETTFWQILQTFQKLSLDSLFDRILSKTTFSNLTNHHTEEPSNAVFQTH